MVKVYYNEFDPFAVLWLKELIIQGYLPKGDVDSRSIKDVRATDIMGYDQLHFFTGIGGWPLALAGAGWGDRPVWSGSAPCQSWSSAGKQKGFTDERHLWPVFYELIKACQPPVIFGEQVASAMVIGKAGKKRNTRGKTSGEIRQPIAPDGGSDEGANEPTWFDTLHTDLVRAHYTVGAIVAPACGVGSPHIRKRLYWVATAKHGTEWMEDAERQRRGRGNDGYSPRPGGRAFSETETTGSGGAGGLADASVQRCNGQSVLLRENETGRNKGKAFKATWSIGAGGLADADIEQCNRRRHSGTTGRGEPANDRPNGGLADAESGGWREERPDAGGMREGVNPSGDVPGGLVSRSGTGGMDDAESIGRGVCDAENVGAPDAPGHVSPNPSHLSIYGELIPTGAGGIPGAVNGYWRDADWLFCRDAKWRPIKSGSTALVNGISPGVGSGRTGNRTQRLKGYGNAIVVPLAIEFIKAFLEAETDG